MNQAYSFIDVVALPPVRGRFAAGEALAVLSETLDEVIWANGAGAAALGFDAIDEAIGAPNPLSGIARRQIAATPGFPRTDPNKTVVVRLTGALSGRLSRLALEPVTLPDGEAALLLSFLDLAAEPEEALQRAVSGFAVEDQMAAILDESGTVLAATPLFGAADFKETELTELARAAANARGHVAKRHLPSRQGLLPAGLAKLADDPALFFLIAIGEGLAQRAAVSAEVLQEPVTRDLTDEHEAEDTTIATGPDPAAAGALRFVWRTDAQGRFSAVSPEFLSAVGLTDDAVIGHSFRDLATRLGFDGNGEITGLLERRDTWSGRSVSWPLPDRSGMRAPVDLAALPVYDRDRAFEGFRGFGVARFKDAVASEGAIETQGTASESSGGPEKTATGANVDDPFQGEPPALADRETSADTAPPADEKIVRLAAHRKVLAEKAGLSSSERNAFQEIGHRLKDVDESRQEPKEMAASSIDAPQQAPTPADAVIDPRPAFPEPSARMPSDAVPTVSADDSPGSEAVATAGAFQSSFMAAEENEDSAARAAIEGGWRRSTGTALADRVLEMPPAAVAEAAEMASLVHAEQPEEADRASEVVDDAVSPPFDGGATVAEIMASDLADKESTDADHSTGPAEEPPSAKGGEARAFVGIEPLGADAPLVLLPSPETSEFVEPASASVDDFQIDDASAVLAEWPEEDGAPSAPAAAKLPEAERELIDALPIALIIHAGDRLDFANREFFSLTGFESLSAISAAGGLEALFPAPVGKHPSVEDRRLFVRRADGEQIPVHAHLQSVPWGGGKSLMLSLRRAEAEPQSQWSALQNWQTDEPAEVPQPLGENVTRLPLSVVSQAPQPTTTESDEGAVARSQALVEEMRAIIDTATDGVVLITPDGRIRNLSQPAEALFGVDSAGVEGQPFFSLFAIESQRAIKDYLSGLTDHGVASVLNDGREVIGREKQGGFIPLFITIGRLPAQGGFCAVLREITQWKRAEEELTQARTQAERSSSQKSEFLARVSHEIRTPLNAIIGFSELMMEERFGPIGNERYREYLRDINRSGTHVLDLVNDLLDISKIEAGEQELSYTAVSLNDALAEAVAIMQPQANRERVIIRSSFASRLPDVVADLRSVRQIALNLLSNAVRYTQAGGQVIVSTVYETSGEVILRIRDTGVGMSSAEIDQALRPFKQINALRRARGDGTGLGLPLTKAMVEANRARFVINSRPGDGTLVEITFPSTRVLAD